MTFAPVVAAPAKLLLHASYKAPAMKRLALPHHEVTLTGTGRDVPVYVERPLIDFQCCMLGHLYRDVLVVSAARVAGGRLVLMALRACVHVCVCVFVKMRRVWECSAAAQEAVANVGRA